MAWKLPFKQKNYIVLRFFYTYLLVVLPMLLNPGYIAVAENNNDRVIENTAFKRGERLIFRAAYNSRFTGNIYAGEATLEILPGYHTENGRSIMHVVGKANTTGLFNLFFKVENRYDTYIDEKSMAPLRFSRNIREGRYRREDDVIFDRDENLAYSSRDTISTPPFVQDMISSIYFARTFSMDSVLPGDAFYLDFHLSDSVYVSRIVFEGYEQIKTSLGTFNTLKFKPQVMEGTWFNQPYPMTLWISDDDNKIPLLVESGLVVGSVRLELMQFGGLNNTIRSFVPN